MLGSVFTRDREYRARLSQVKKGYNAAMSDVLASKRLRLLFFVSGCAALLYQVVWQRTLFSIYGINVEAVTMVVTVFMLGLGLGSLAGGAISKDPKRPAILYFAIAEASIGVFGLFSLALFHLVGRLTLQLPAFGIAVVTFCLLLVPTMLMGGTLPLLVAHVSRRSKNVGRSVSTLYFVNTLGSAIASFLSVFVLLRFFGQHTTIEVAAALNFVSGGGALLLHAREARETSQPASTADAAS